MCVCVCVCLYVCVCVCECSQSIVIYLYYWLLVGRVTGCVRHVGYDGSRKGSWRKVGGSCSYPRLSLCWVSAERLMGQGLEI